jgi:hypothetical protein
MSPDLYKKLLKDNTTKHYQTTDNQCYTDVNLEAKRLAKDLDIDERVDIMAKREAFITLKDHKENFRNNLPCRLINPAKSELGRISKQLLDDINTELRQLTKVQQWRNTAAVTKWFTGIKKQEMLCIYMLRCSRILSVNF